MGHQATQHLCLTIHNNLRRGDIIFKNLISIRYTHSLSNHDGSSDYWLTIIISGQPYEKSETLRLLSTEDLEKIRIQPGASKLISFCGSATLGLGIEGMLDLHSDNETRITSLYWNGPWNRVDNQFHVSSTDHELYTVTASIPPVEGVLGDISVNVRSLAER